MIKKHSFVHPEPEEEIYNKRALPDGSVETVYYFSNEENEYCDIIPIDDLPKKKSNIDEKTKIGIVKSITNVKHKLKLIKPSVFNSKIVFYSTLNFKDRDYPEFDCIRISLEPNRFIID